MKNFSCFYLNTKLCNYRSMIGEPMNFQHTAHIGSRDVEMPNDQLTALQMQMRSKGGYETTYKVRYLIVCLLNSLFKKCLYLCKILF